MTAALALLSSLLWGVSDFLGGTVSRRLHPLAVIAVSQAVALVALLVVATATGAWGDDTAYLLPAVGAGLIGLVALSSFYAALATGTMGVVAPIAALGVAVPVAVGLVRGESPTPLQLAGVAVAVVGVVLASGPQGSTPGSTRPLVLAVVAAAGFGVVLVLVARGSESSPTMTLLVMRVTTVSVLGVLAVARRTTGGVTVGVLPIVALLGLGDVSANAAFAVASRSGLVSIVAVLSSLYPAVTVLLARQLHGERLRRVQEGGVVVTLAGVLLIAAGGGTG